MKSDIIAFLKLCLNFARNHHTIDKIIIAIILVLIAICGSKLLRALTGILHRRLAKFTPKWLLILNESFKDPLILIIKTGLLYLAVRALPIPSEFAFLYDLAYKIFIAFCLLWLGVAFWHSEALCGLLLSSAQNRLDIDSNKTMIGFFEKIYRAIVAIITVLSILQLFGIPVAGLMAGAGVAGLAVSLACQSTFSSLIAGIALVLEHPFGIGDYIALGDIQGIVEDISFRSTRIRTLDKVLVTVENSAVCAQYIQNLTNRKDRLLNFTVSLRYDTPPDRVRKLCADITAMLEQDPQVVPGSAHVVLLEFASSTMDVDIRVYVTTLMLQEFRDLRNRINLNIMDLMKADGCEFAYPSASIYLETADDNSEAG